MDKQEKDKEFEELIKQITNSNIKHVQEDIAKGFMKMYELAYQKSIEKFEEIINKHNKCMNDICKRAIFYDLNKLKDRKIDGNI